MKYEITSQNTKKMLANTLISLMKKKSLSKISISEIVKTCQINRKTFYYHFADIYELLEWHLEQELVTILNSMNSTYSLSDFESSFRLTLNFLNENTYLYNCADDPYGCEMLMEFINKKLYPFSLESITQLEQEHKKQLNSDYKCFLAEMMTKVAALSIIDNIKHKNDYDYDRMLLYLSDTLNASIEGFFSKI